MTTAHTHDTLAPSDAARWSTCYGAIALTQHYLGRGADNTSEFADEGTDAHTLASDAFDWLGKGALWNGDAARWYCRSQIGRPMPMGNVVGPEMAQYVGRYCAKIVEYTERNSVYRAHEQRVKVTSEDGVYITQGTSDFINVQTLTDLVELQVHDLKYGMGVRVDAQANRQLLLYAAGTVQSLPDDLRKRINRILLVIHQPRLNHLSEWACTPDYLQLFVRSMDTCARENHKLIASVKTWAGTEIAHNHLRVSDKACRFCQIKAICPAQIREINRMAKAELPEGFDPNDGAKVAACYAAIARIQLWCKALSDHAMTLAQRNALPGYKVVPGREGDRAWKDVPAVEKDLLAQGLNPADIHSKPALLTPAQLEKQVSLSDEQWQALATQIQRAPGKPTLAEENDPRPRIATVDMFTDLAKGGINDLL